jgi:hypothetical protein
MQPGCSLSSCLASVRSLPLSCGIADHDWACLWLNPVENGPGTDIGSLLLDDLIGGCEQCRRHDEAEGLGGLEIND